MISTIGSLTYLIIYSLSSGIYRVSYRVSEFGTYVRTPRYILNKIVK